MGQNSSVAASLKPEQRKQLFIEIQSSSQPITAIALLRRSQSQISLSTAAERKSSGAKKSLISLKKSQKFSIGYQ